MSRPVMLDLCAGQGGATKGYQDAGWLVLAVDLDPKVLLRNPADGTHAGDIISVLTALILGVQIPFTMRDGSVWWVSLDDIDAIHVSPPCQAYSIATAGNPAARAKHVRLIAASRDLLVQTGKPWVIENVEQARSQLNDPVMLCGRMFGLSAPDEDGMPLVLDRHRLFESNVPLTAPAHPKHGAEQVAGVYGGSRHAKRRDGETLAEVAPRDRHAARVERGGGYVPRSIPVQQALLGIDWMTVRGMQESIPPAYAEWVGGQLQAAVRQEVAA
jgi:DNA (cytosine-5)-methyltransferase 1